MSEEYSIVQIDSLLTKKLKKSISIVIEFDDVYYIATMLSVPIVGFGETAEEATEHIKIMIEETYNDLCKDDNLSEEWTVYKQYLEMIIE